MGNKLHNFALQSVFLLMSFTSAAALADGMPFPEIKPKPVLTPIDPSLMEPSPPAAAAPLPLKTEVPPVPETRVVEAQENPSFFGLSVGLYDPFSHGKASTSFNAEWQPRMKMAGILQPIFGGMVTTGGSLYGYGGIGLPLKMGEHIKFMPSVAAGLYKRGGGYDLGQTVVFRTGAELAYQFDDKSRVGLNFHVLTNGTSTSRHDRTEVLGLSYTIPLDVFSKPDHPAIMPSLAGDDLPQPPSEVAFLQ